MNIYVGNISRESSEADIKQAFEEYGEVSSINLIKDKFTGQYRGFGFVEMPDNEKAAAAIKALDGQRINGRALNVAEAKPKTESSSNDGRRDFKKDYKGGGNSGNGNRRY